MGHKNQEYCVETLMVRAPSGMMVLSGSEDGRICGWDMHTQDMVVDSKIDANINLVSTIDYDHKFGLIAASGNFKGVYINKLSTL